MNAVAKKQIEAQVIDQLGHVFQRQEKRPREILLSGIREIDETLGGFPRGAITEIHGTATCGRTSLMLATLAAATASEESCALIDCSNTFDLFSAAAAGVDFSQLLWVRCNHQLEHAFKSTDLLLHGGGFGLVVLNLADMPARTLRRIISTWWFRFRRALEDTPTALLVISPITCTRSCAALALELHNDGASWPVSAPPFEAAGSLTAPDTCSAKHLSLVSAAAHDPPYPTLPNHGHFLKALTIRVQRERPVAWANNSIQFTPQLALTVFGDIR